MNKLALLTLSAALFVACGVTEPEEPRQICYDKEIGAADVYGTGMYSERREEFQVETNCTSALNCTATMTIRECKDVDFIY